MSYQNQAEIDEIWDVVRKKNSLRNKKRMRWEDFTNEFFEELWGRWRTARRIDCYNKPENEKSKNSKI